MPEPTRFHPLITPARLKKRAMVYLRQSTIAQTIENWGSTAVQLSQIELLEEYGWERELIDVIDADLGRSGATTVGRTGWQEMLAKVATNEFGAISCFNVSRLARSVYNFEELRIMCRHHGVIMVLDGRPCDPNNPGDTVLIQVLAALAQHDNGARAEDLRRARREKAARGKVVSSLPTGWIKGADDSWEFDPEAKPVIDLVYARLRIARSLREAVRTLRAEGVKLPVREGGELNWKAPNVERLRQYVLNETYTGVYTYGRTEMRPNPADPHAKNVQMPVTEDRWVRVEGRLPRYVAAEEQSALREKFAGNGFNNRHRPGRGLALCQGLLRCSQCGYTLTVADPRNGYLKHYYQCTSRAATQAVKSCLSFRGREIDAAIQRLVLSCLESPPAEMLREALAQARADEAAQAEHRQAEYARLRHVELRAHSRWTATSEEYDRVRDFATRQYQEAIKAREQFERTMAEQPVSSVDTSEEEIAELCAVAADVPSLWFHPAVTNQDRKEIVRCLIRCIVVTRTAEDIDFVVTWVSGAETRIRLLRRAGLYRLIRELHEAGNSVPSIKELLSVERPDSGQCWNLTAGALYQILRKLDLSPNPVGRQQATTAIDAARRLYDDGHTYEEIKKELRDAGMTNAWGKPVEMGALSSWLGGRRRELEMRHREALLDADMRRLSNRQIAEEFNKRRIPRVGGREWTEDAVRQRKAHLKRRYARETDADAPARRMGRA